MPSTLIVSRFGCAKGDVESKLGSLSSCPFVGLDCGMRQREVTCGAGSQGTQLLDVQTAPGLRHYASAGNLSDKHQVAACTVAWTLTERDRGTTLRFDLMVYIRIEGVQAWIDLFHHEAAVGQTQLDEDARFFQLEHVLFCKLYRWTLLGFFEQLIDRDVLREMSPYC